MSDLGVLQAKITAQTEAFEQGLDKAGSSVDTLGKKTETANGQITKSSQASTKALDGLKVAAAAAAAAAVALAGAFIKATADNLKTIDANAKLARQLNMTNTELRTLHLAAEYSGVSVETMTKATRRLDIELGNAIKNSEGAAEKFEQIGLSVQELQNMTADERLLALGGAFDSLSTHTERAAAANALFGEEGASLILLLNDAQASIGRASAEVRKYDLALSELQTAGIEALNDDLTTMKEVTVAASQQITAGLAPALGIVTNLMLDSADSAKKTSENIHSFIMASSTMETVSDVFSTLSGSVAAVKAALTPLAQSILPELAKIGQTATEEFAFLTEGFNTGNAASMALAVAGETLATAFRVISLAVQTVIKNVADLVRAIMDSVGVVGSFFDYIRGRASMDDVKEQLVVAGDAFKQFGLNVYDNVKGYILGIGDELSMFVGNVQATAVQVSTAFETTQVESKDRIISAWEEMRTRYTEIQDDMQRKTEETAKKETKTWQQKVDGIQGTLQYLSRGMDKESRVQFEIGKGLAIASAIIDGLKATQSSYAAGAAIGGPPVGAAFAAATVLATAGIVNQIRSQTFGGGGGTISAPAATTPSVPAEPRSSGTMMVNMQGDFFSGDMVRGLMDKISEAQADGYRVVMA